MHKILMTWRTNMHVLVVEDDARAGGRTEPRAERARHGGRGGRQRRPGRRQLQRAEQIEVVVLDIGLPGMDGFEVVRRLRARGSQVPVLLLTARDAIEDRVRGLELGADDYLVKPFATAELVARLKALVRRNTPKPALLALGDLALDVAAKRARVGDKTIELSVREWAVLEYLLQHGARVVSKQQIIDAILPWGDDLTLNAVEVYISRLRLKIADAGVSIRTIRGFGYMLEQTPAAS
jgi:two-component system OmpR family response regulator